MKEEKKKVIKTCACGERFIESRKWMKYCSAKCRWSAWAVNNPRVKKEVHNVV